MNIQTKPWSPKRFKLKETITLTLIIVFMLCINVLWHTRNELPQGKDTFSHLNKLNIAGKMVHMQKHHYYYKYDQSYLYNLIFLVYDYPFLYYYASLLFYLLFFPLLGFKAIYISSAFFSSITILFTYKTARFLLGRKEGILAAYLCAFAPFNITNSRNFNLEMALIATISMSIYFFLRSNFFYNRKFSLFTALAASASMLIRATAAVPLSGIFLWFFASALLNGGKNSRKAKIQRKNFLLFLIVFLSAALIYYGNYNVLSNHLMRSFSTCGAITDITSKIAYYWKGIGPQAIGGRYIFTLVFLFLLTKSNNLLRNMVFFLLFMPLCIIILLPKGNLREELEWIMPLLPVIIIILSSVLKIKSKVIRNSLAFFMPLFLILQCLSLSFHEHKSLNPLLKRLFTGKIFAAQKCSAYKNLFDDLSVREISGRLKIGIMAETAQLHFIPIFSNAVDLKRKKWQLTELPIDSVFSENMADFDYIIIVSGKNNLINLKNHDYTDSLVFEDKYSFNSDYFEFYEFVFLFKPKK